jgi:hypothetical protein
MFHQIRRNADVMRRDGAWSGAVYQICGEGQLRLFVRHTSEWQVDALTFGRKHSHAERSDVSRLDHCVVATASSVYIKVTILAASFCRLVRYFKHPSIPPAKRRSTRKDEERLGPLIVAAPERGYRTIATNAMTYIHVHTPKREDCRAASLAKIA